MGDQDEINIAGQIGLDVAVALLNGLVALVHAAVHAEALAAGLDHVAGTGDCLGRAQKLYFHMHSEWVVDGQRPQRASHGIAAMLHIAASPSPCQTDAGSPRSCRRAPAHI